MTDIMEVLKEHKCFGGVQRVLRHRSEATKTDMDFAVFEPSGDGERPVLYYLSGLTCTWENVVTKAGAQAWAAEQGIILVCPDTSPRGAGVADRPSEDDLGCGAGFYVDATQPPWREHYQMERYITLELPQVIEPELRQFSGKRGIFGHSMGGHGALTLALRHPDFYSSVSAFSPVVAPAEVPWGRKAFGQYLGANESAWQDHDACQLIAARGCPHDLLVDVGTSDPFLETQLRPELLEQVCQKRGVDLQLRRQLGYDHSYYFIATFMREHLTWHRERLRA